MSEGQDRRRYTRCSFCGKGADQVRKLVAGPGVFICNECVELCMEVLDDDSRRNKQLASATDDGVLAARELQVANMFARGISAEAVGQCLRLNSRLIEFQLARIHEKMSASPDAPREDVSRRDMYRWLSVRGQLWTVDELDVILVRAISAFEAVPEPPGSLSDPERDFLANRMAAKRAALEDVRRALRRSGQEEI